MKESVNNIKIKRWLFVCLSLVILTGVGKTFAQATTADSALKPAKKATIVLTAEEREWLKQNPHIKFTALTDQPPFSMKDSKGRHVGIMADIFSHLNSAMGQELEFELLDDNTKVHIGAKDKGVYGNSAVFKTPQHQKEYLLSNPYFLTPFYVFATKNNHAAIKQPNDLKGKKVAIIRGHRALTEYLNKINGVEKVVVNSPLEQMQKVISGEADALLGYITYPHLVNKYLMVDLVIAFIAKPEMTIHVGINPEHPILQSILNKAIATINEGTRQDIFARWTEMSREASPQIKLTAKEKAWLAKHPKIVLGGLCNHPPVFMCDSDNRVIGIQQDFVDLLNNKLGINIQISIRPSWQVTLKRAMQGETDGIAVSHVVELRRRQFNLTTPLYSAYSYIYARSDELEKYTSLEKLIGQRVGYLTDFASVKILLQDNPGISSVPLKTPEELARALLEGKLDAVIAGPSLEYWRTQNVVEGFKISALIPQTKVDIALGLSKDMPELLTIINKGIAAINTEEKRMILLRWIGTAPQYETIKSQREDLELPELVSFDTTGFLLQSLASIFVGMALVIAIAWLVRGRPKQLTIRDTLFLISFVLAGLIVAIGAFVSMLLEGEQKQSVIESNRYESYELAIELKQSSDDLTRFARTYVVTGNPKYEQYFRTIMAIRDGKRAHPKEVPHTYWDQVTAEIVGVNQQGELYSIEQKMIKLGLSDEERDKLTEAKMESDDLIKLEDVAMNAVKGLYKDDDGQFTIKGEPDLEMARGLLHGKEYHDAKSRIMKPIEQFFTLLEWRTTHALNAVRQQNQAIIYTVAALALVTIGFLIFVFFLFKRRITSPLALLETGAQVIEGGDYSYSIDIASRDEMGSLATSFNAMARGIEQRTQELQASESRMNFMLSSSPVVIYTCSTTPPFGATYISPNVRQRMGFKPEQFTENTGFWAEQIHPDDRDQILSNLSKLFEHGIYEHEYRFRMNDGSYRWMHDEMALVFDEAREPVEIVGYWADITERKKSELILEEQQQKLSGLYELSPLGIALTDMNGNYLEFNEAFRMICGYPAEELKSLDYWTLTPNEYEEQETAQLEMLTKTGRYGPYEKVYRQKNGNHIPIRLHGMLVKGRDGQSRIWSIVENITDSKAAEEELKQALIAADAANQAKSRFLSNMSHELRTPLNAILGFSQLMSMDTTIAPEHQENLSIINRSGAHLLSLINDVLDLSKIEAGGIQLMLEDLDLTTLLQEVSEMMRARAKEKGLQFIVERDVDLPHFIYTDKAKLLQILINLLGNAVKFTFEGGVTLHVRTQAIEGESDMVTLQLVVADNGPGIAANQLEHIFDPFAQAEQVQTDIKGTGLGLAISKSLVELLGGEIRVASKLGEGSLFHVDLPVALAEGTAIDSRERTHQVLGLESGQPAWRILVVEDYPANQRLMSSLLHKVGFETRLAENGKQAITQFEQWQPHLIWMDMRMPVMDGYEATRRIRTLPGGNEVKIVALTASAFTEQKNKMVEAGCDDLILKPFQPQEIYDCMAQLLGVRYVYASTEAVPQETGVVTVTTKMLDTLPLELLASLRDAAFELDVKQAQRVLDQIAETAPEPADALRRLVDNFDFRTIKTLVSSVISEKTKDA